ncbi:hypothetical protein G6F32_016265 [Rhizopus arrhizus]|nr:hypothetical protein G6F32_016265 [Rhizopus arrhizus]
MAASSASRLTVTRVSPAAFKAAALRASTLPLVVRVRSSGRPSGVRNWASWPTRFSMCLRSRGSPPVRRIFSTPSCVKMPASRLISSNDSKSECGMKV